MERVLVFFFPERWPVVASHGHRGVLLLGPSAIYAPGSGSHSTATLLNLL